MTSTSGAPAIAVHGGAFDIAPPDAWRPSRGLPGGGACGLAGAGGRRQRPGRGRTGGPRARGIGHLRRRAWLGPERGRLHRARRRDDGRGAALQVGSVTSVRGVPHAITLARRVLESPFAVFTGAGAHQFAERDRGRDVRPGRPRLGPRAGALGGPPGATRIRTGSRRCSVTTRSARSPSTGRATWRPGTSTGGMPYKPAGSGGGLAVHRRRALRGQR